jgi:hypothetical protein
MPVHPGVEVSGWEVKDFIGRGATGAVYQAYSDVLARSGAIKVLHSVAPGSDASMRFQREAQAIAQLRHPNIIAVHDYGESGGAPYMVIQYLAGGSLADRLGGGRHVARAEALRMLREIASALDHAHAHGVVHRDVKPANVLIGDDGSAVLADFGLAKIVEDSSVKTISGVTTGTPAYMAPEQVTGGKAGPASDLYALATMAYEMVTGHLPFEVEGVLELLYAQAHRPPPAPSTKAEGISRAVDSVLLRGLAKDPSARWDTATEMVDALEAALNRPPEPATGLRRLRARGEARRAEAERRPRPAGRSRPFLAALIMLPILAGGFVAFAPQSQEPTVGMMNTTVEAGDYLLVAVHKASPNQPVEVVIGTGPDAYRVTLHANQKGEVNGWISIPREIVSGQHVAQFCIGGICRPFAIVQVTAPPVPLAVVAGPEVATVTPDTSAASVPPADGNPAPETSAAGGKPSIKAPNTNSVAAPAPSPNPTSTQEPAGGPGKIKSSPTPRVSPSVKPPGPLVLLVSGSPASSVKRGTALQVRGSGFETSKQVTVTVTPAAGGSQTLVAGFSPAADGSFDRTQVVPTGLPAGSATVAACTTGTSVCATKTITLT